MMVHPIVAQIKPSLEQLPAIQSRGRDVVVTASAGTGKTRTLVARYLSLLAQGLPLRSIVAITFTRKAAREMRNRVREEMRRYLERTDLERTERQRWLGLYSELDAARIGTIHSLCTEILRAHPAEAGVDPRFVVLDEGPGTILRRQAVEEALSWAADDIVVVPLFASFGERELRNNLEHLLGRRLDVAEAFSQLSADPMGRWQQVLAGRQKKALVTLWDSVAWNQTIATLRENQALQPDDLIEAQRQDALAAIDGTEGLPLPEILTCLSRLEEIRLSGGKARAWPGGQEQRDAVKQGLSILRSLWKNRPDVLRLSMNALDQILAESLPALQSLFRFADTRYETLKRERHILDFDDLEQKALLLLRRDAAVRARWQHDVLAILVDEFQDTNSRQRDLVTLLNGNRDCLFIVGDGKQGIYRFRGADVTVFRDEKRRIERKGGAAFFLDISYRAHRELIAGWNDLLRPVLGETVDPERPWVEPFASLRHHREKPGPGFTSPHIELHLTVGTKGGDALDRAADALVWRIAQLKESGSVYLTEKSGTRPLEYDDIAILCRASSSFGAYEDALERAGIPFLTVAGRGFYDRPEIRDLLNALAALADPTDDLALAGLLRSPALALSDEALYLFCRERRRIGPDVPLWEVLQKEDTHLSQDDADRARRATRIIAELHTKVGRTAVADLFKGFLDGTDYRAALIQAGQGRGARNVSKLLADAHGSGIVSVGEFLEYMSSLRGSGAREGEARAPAEGAVQIMSVHAAKGLEFPIVVIGDATYSGIERNIPLVDPELGVLLPKREDDVLPAAYVLGKVRSRDQDAAEADRLLYVAATRAREKLIFSGCIRLNQGGSPSQMTGWLGQIAGPVGLDREIIEHDEEGAGAIQLECQVGQTPVQCTIYEPCWSPPSVPLPPVDQAVPRVRVPLPLLDPVSPGKAHIDDRTAAEERDPPQRIWRVVPAVDRPTAPAWVIGSLVHEALAVWRFPDGDPFVRWARARARSYGLTDQRQIGDAVAETRRLLRRFHAHPLFQEMDTAERRLHEVPYSLLADRQPESGIIDALYLRQGDWTVVEFKTDDVRDEAQLRELLTRERYQEQAQRYAAAVERLVGQRPQVILCMLNYKGAVRLIR